MGDLVVVSLMDMSKRIKQLQVWNVPEKIIAFAHAKFPHPAFEAICERLPRNEARLGLALDQVKERAETGGLSVALWQHDVGDGHAIEVVYCTMGAHGIEYWHVMYSDCEPAPQSQLIGRSEQGLYFWMFFFLIEPEFSLHGERAYETLVAAAKSVGFRFLIEVFRLEEEIGSDSERFSELSRHSCNIGT